MLQYSDINNANEDIDMLTFNGKQYAKNDKEFVDTLFTSGNTANGFYKKGKSGIKLYNMQKELIAFIKRDSSPFIVNAYTYAGDGKDRYMFSTSSTVEIYLSIYDLGYRETKEVCQQAINQLFN
jgi:hypothetical protein